MNQQPPTTVLDRVFDVLKADVFTPDSVLEKDITIASFFERYFKIRDKHDELVTFKAKAVQKLYRRQKIAAVKAGKKPWFLVPKSRQIGITTWEQGENTRITLTRPHSFVMTLAHTESSTRAIWEMVNRFYMHLPDEVKPERTQAKTELRIPSLDSLFVFHTAGGQSPAHGKTLSKVHLSEAARYRMKDSEMADFMAGVEEACAHGEIVAESTTQGAQGWYYQKVQEALNGESDYTVIFLPWYADPTNRILPSNGDKVIWTEEEKERSDKLGPWDDAQILYRRAKKRQAGKLFLQEFPETIEEAFLVPGRCWFEADVLRYLVSQCRIPERTYDNEQLLMWHPPVEGETYFIGADVAEGLDKGDFDAAGVLDKQGRQCAALHGKWTRDEYAKKLDALGRLYNTAWLAVEAQNHGGTILNLLQKAHYPRLFVHQDSLNSKAAGKLGWQTTSKTRPLMLDKLRDEAVEGMGMEVNDRRFLNECMTFVLDAQGKRYEAMDGCHDDRVMSWAIAWFVREIAPREAGVWVL